MYHGSSRRSFQPRPRIAVRSNNLIRCVEPLAKARLTARNIICRFALACIGVEELLRVGGERASRGIVGGGARDVLVLLALIDPRHLVHRKARAAATCGFGVGVTHREVVADQFIGVVKLGTGEQVEANGIDEDPDVAALDDQVVGLGSLIEFELVLKAAAPSGEDGDAKAALPSLSGDDFGDTGRRPVSHSKRRHVVHAGNIRTDWDELKRHGHAV
jgi:hypothetical protein